MVVNDLSETRQGRCTTSIGSPQPLVTALICNYNYGQYLAEAIDSVLAQTWKWLEVIVVDDGSTDSSREVLEKYSGRVQAILKENGGQASAFNVGIARARGEIICFLDSDDVWFPDKVALVVEKFQSGPWTLVCHEMDRMDSSGMAISDSSPEFLQDLEPKEGDLLAEIQATGYRWVFSPTSGMSIRSEVARALIPLPEEDWRICADAPIAFGSACYGATGKILRKLACYRYHNTNGYASLIRKDRARYEVEVIVLRARSHLYVAHQLDLLGRKNVSPFVLTYPLYRRCCLMAAGSPVQSLVELWRQNLRYHKSHQSGGWWHALRYALSDTFITVLISLHMTPKRYRALRIQYRAMKENLDPAIDRLLTDLVRAS